MTLDIEKFRKVRALMESGATEGERAAARSRAEQMARKAGITLEEALQRDDAQQQQSRNPWSDDAYWSGFWTYAHESIRKEAEQKEAQQKQKEAEYWAAYWAQEAKNEKARFDAAELKYGPYEAAMAETERERLLRETLEPIAVRKKFSNSDETYIDGFGDWLSGHPSKAVTDVVNEAYPLSDDMQTAWKEYFEWEALYERRYAYSTYYENPVHIRCRQAALEAILDTMTVRHWGDFEIRLEWRRYKIGRWSDYDEAEFLDRIEKDLNILRDLRILRDIEADSIRSIRRRRGNRASVSDQFDLFAN